jgi:hypothetical protein
MNTLLKKGALAGALLIAAGMALTPAQAAWRNGEAAAVGFGAGAVVGAAAASSYYGPRYYGGPYGYYGGPYAYEPGPVYAQPVYAEPVYVQPAQCWNSTDDTRGFGYYGACRTPQSKTIRGQGTPSNSGR